jgi:hypothetical protein
MAAGVIPLLAQPSGGYHLVTCCEVIYMYKKSVLILSVIALFIVAATALAVSAAYNISEIQLFTGSLTATLRPWRWLIIGSIIVFWPYIIDLLAKKNNLPDERIKYGKSLRYRVLIYFVVFEILIVENVAYQLFGRF